MREMKVLARVIHTLVFQVTGAQGMHSCFSLKSKSDGRQTDLITQVAHSPQDGMTDKFIHAAKLEMCTHSSAQKHLINLSL